MAELLSPTPESRMAAPAAKATLGLKNRPSLQGTFLPVNSAMKDNLKRDK
ncbi:MAG: hypothetical protein WCD32_13775 [Azonexus sp.]